MPGQLQELRWGIIGCGVISHDFVLSLRNSKQPHKVVAAAASSLDRAQGFVKDLGIEAKAYGEYSELLQDTNVDIVYIGLLNDAHLEWILKSLDADKHVLSEKPMVINANQLQQIMDKSKEKKKFVMEAFWSRFFPAWRKIREIIESKELGELKVVGMNFGEYVAENRFHLHKNESPMLDIGYYVTGLAMYAFGEEKPEKVEISGEKNSDGCDLWGNITLKFSGGRHALLYYNGTMRASTYAYLAFEKGLIELPYFFWCPEGFTMIKGEIEKGEKKTFDFKLKDNEGYNLNHCAGLHYEADHVFEKISEGETESPIMPLRNTKQILEILDELRKILGVEYKHECKHECNNA